MAHVIYHKTETYFLGHYTKALRGKGSMAGHSKESWLTERAAKAALTRVCKKDPNINRADFDIAEAGHFHRAIEKHRKSYNNITGDGKKAILLGVNTPLCCDPGSETYHTM